MMKNYKLHFDVPKNVTLNVKSGDEIKTVTDENKTITLECKDDNIIEISQTEPGFKPFLRILLFVLTYIFQGLFNIVFMNVNGKWYEKVCPYLMNVKFKIDDLQNCRLNFKYQNGDDCFSRPTIICDNAKAVSCEYFRNIDSFYHEYFKFCNRFLSVAFTAISLFMIFAFLALKGDNAQKSVFFFAMIALSLGVFAISLTVIIFEYCRMKRIIKSCN